MATVPTAGPQSVNKPRRNFVEVKAPEQFQFTKVGQSLEGILFPIEPTSVKGKEAIEYMIELENGDRLTFLGTYDLNRKLSPKMVGHPVHIRYESNDTTNQKPGQSAMKVFRVGWDESYKAAGF